ncbi:hypothetical protein Bca4012_073151 [Brassica carinata]|uniref:F-box domain-containing protein n=1 Tax=Brassica carinata TaxID=52824 RepID=A0A8X7QJG6_BRACI|nr:hypothetical protein Bca52824_065478 [Brassica carinata]
MDGRGNSRLKIVSLDTELSIKTIPNELIIEILSRVPARSIATCRRVLKEWKSLLLTPAFTDSFLAISSAQPRILLTFKCSGKWHFCTAPQPQHLGFVSARSHPCLHSMDILRVSGVQEVIELDCSKAILCSAKDTSTS